MAVEPDTIICFESPYRVAATLQDLAATFGGDRSIAVGRELTKHFEEVVRGTVAEAQAHFEKERPRGEFTVVVSGLAKTPVKADKAESHLDGKRPKNLPRNLPLEKEHDEGISSTGLV